MQIEQAVETYKYGRYGVVTVTEVAGNLSKVKTEIADEFWVRTDKLKHNRAPRVNRVLVTKVDDLADFELFILAVLFDPKSYMRITAHHQSVERVCAEIEEYAGVTISEDQLGSNGLICTGASWQVAFQSKHKALLPEYATSFTLRNNVRVVSSKLLVLEFIKRGLKL